MMKGLKRPHFFRSVALPLVLTLAVSGCAHQTPDPGPQEQLPERFSRSGDVVLPAQFWQAFADAELDALVQQALQQNHSLRATAETLVQARAVLRQRDAARWPSVDMNLSAQRIRGDSANAGDIYSGGLAASYELDLWGRVSSAADAAEFDLLATEEAIQAARISLAAEVTSVWYQLVGQRSLQTLQLQQIDANEKVLQLITARFQQGLSDAADVLRQKVLLEQNHAALADYNANIAVLEHALAVLTGAVAGTAQFPDQAILAELPPLPDTGLTADWLQNRPDIRQAFYGLQAADARLAVAVAERYPRIDLTASVTSASTSASSLFDDWFDTLAANALLPLFDAGARKAEVTRNESLFRQQFERYQQTVLQAVAEVEDALTRESYQQTRIQHLQNKLELNNQVVQRLGLRYRSGNVDYLDVLQALVDKQQTEQDLVTARQQRTGYRIALARALATGWVEADSSQGSSQDPSQNQATSPN
ncbi:MAG: efflux transporter outer membrane subunit [Pseudomonadota bacterium]